MVVRETVHPVRAQPQPAHNASVRFLFSTMGIASQHVLNLHTSSGPFAIVVPVGASNALEQPAYNARMVCSCTITNAIVIAIHWDRISVLLMVGASNAKITVMNAMLLTTACCAWSPSPSQMGHAN